MILSGTLPVQAENAGLFVSRGVGRHPDRAISSYELIFVRQGQLAMFEEERQFTISAGETLLLWPNRRHGGITGYPTDLRFYWIHFQLTDTGRCLALPPPHTIVARPDRLTTYYRAFLDDQESGTDNSISAALLVMLMLAEVAHAHGGAAAIQGSRLRLAQRADTYIRLHYASPINTSQMADTLDCHPDYLGRVFTAVYGYTLTEAIHRQRLRQARQLLMDGESNITQIAGQCGFTDVGYFRRLFRRYEGMSPVAYRDLYARVHVNSE